MRGTMKQIKVGLIGFGTIGTGVIRVFQKNAALMSSRLRGELTLAKVCDLDITTDRGVVLPAGVLTTNINDVLENPEIDIVIELIGGYEPAKTFVLKAMEAGKHVITANKALIAMHGPELFAAAEKNGVDLMFEAAVGGGIPVISSIKENLCANTFTSIFGILNGTCNYIFTKMTDEGEDLEPVLKQAQEKGYAEADPTFDVEGIDTAHKLALLASLCFGTKVDFKDVYCEGIRKVSALDIRFAREFGYKIKLLAIGKNNNGKIELRVHPTMISTELPLADVDGVYNAIRLSGDFVGPVLLIGQGAGMDATASAVMGDVMSVARNLIVGGSGRTPSIGCNLDQMGMIAVKGIDEVVSRYYLRFMASDQPGVLASIAGILGKHDISIISMIQPERHDRNAVPIVILTHEAQEANVRRALDEIDALDVVREPTHLIRIEDALD